MNKKYKILAVGAFSALLLVLGVAIILGASTDDGANDNQISESNQSVDVPERLTAEFDDVDFTKSSIDLNEVLSGGPGKDGIPAISNPTFVPIAETEIPDTTRGVYMNVDGEEKFYPYNILVWHEIVNDTIGNQDVAVTFCPLCGSAVVFDRSVNGEVSEFGVSGFLWESNMIMYDRTDSPTFWSQSIGQAIAGEKTDQQLNRVPFQLLEVGTVKQDFPNTQIMSLDTGHSRSYDQTPYGNYDFEEDLFFPVSVEDKRYSAKEIFYIIPVEGDSGRVVMSIAVRIGEVPEDQTVDIPDKDMQIIKKQNGEIVVTNSSGEVVPGYFEMWFSWATQHQDDGTVFDPS